MKIYIIRWETLYSNGEYSNGISYVFDSLEKAKKCLEEIKENVIEERKEYNDKSEENVHELLTEDGFILDLIDEYDKYVIEEMEVR